MSYTTAEARQGLLESVALATAELEAGLERLGQAYELLDDRTADRLEAELFRPVQLALGRAKATSSGFAERHALVVPAIPPAGEVAVPRGTTELVATAVEAVEEAELLISELQDSMAPVEVGDAELRAGLAAVRELAGRVPGAARGFMRDLGR